MLEHLCLHIRCRTLFATHFHELGALAEHGTPGDVADKGMALPGLHAMQMGIHDTSGGLAMTHQVRTCACSLLQMTRSNIRSRPFCAQLTPGMASQSYGLHVAEIAGLPSPVLHRAAQVLDGLTKQSRDHVVAIPPPADSH